MPYKDPEKRKEAIRRSKLKHRERTLGRQRDYYQRNKERIAAWARAYRQGDKHRSWAQKPETRARKRDLRIRIEFGLTAEQYDVMLERQGGVCAICKRQETQKRKGTLKHLAVDHCHKSGKVRGLLCQHCNKGLGMFRDDDSLLSAAIDYLRRSADAFRAG